MHPTGYRYVTFKNVHYKEHRLIWLWVTGVWPENQTDHVDGDRSNNRFENLRDVTGSENQHKITYNKNNTSGFRGVCYHKDNKRYVARIRVNCKIHHLGYFDTPEDASVAYQAAAAARST
jgi:hypothetical protein